MDKYKSRRQISGKIAKIHVDYRIIISPLLIELLKWVFNYHVKGESNDKLDLPIAIGSYGGKLELNNAD